MVGQLSLVRGVGEVEFRLIVRAVASMAVSVKQLKRLLIEGACSPQAAAP